MKRLLFYAHSGTPNDTSDWQPLDHHLLSVAGLAAEMAAPLGLQKAAYLAGLLHDLGKYTSEFQKRLAGAEVRVDHSTAGAALLFGDLAKGIDKEVAELIAYCIAGHHAGLPDRFNETASCLNRRVEASRPTLDAVWQSELPVDTRGLLPRFTFRPDQETAAFQLSVMTRMISSCLVDADFKDTEVFYGRLEGRQADRQWAKLQDLLPAFTTAFDAHMAHLTASAPELNRLRTDILAHVRGKASESRGLFTLTVPTGGGKTLASLGFAIDHARRHGHRRIIYAIPFHGARIETRSRSARSSRPAVAPSRGRGSKQECPRRHRHGPRRPFTGARIETISPMSA